MSTTSNTLKPSYNPLLWAQLRPSTRIGPSESSQSVTSVIPLQPENKTNTSLRVVLHDTKSALEQFSDRLGKLVNGVEHATREIDRVSSSFTEGQDKVLEELNICVNRSQKGLLETLGSPAQATVLDEVKNSQGEANRKLALLEDKAELVQRAISEQQGHILTSLATITPLAPLLKDSPQQQNQILSTLTSLLPLLPLLQSLPAQIKASQEEVFASATKCTAALGCSISLSSPQSYNGTDSCAPTNLTSDPLPMQCVNRKLPRSGAVDEEQQRHHMVKDSSNGKRQSTLVLPPSCAVSSGTLHPGCIDDRSNSHVQKSMTASDSICSEPLHRPTYSTDRDPEKFSLVMPPPPSECENSRDRKRPRLISNTNTQGKDISPRKTTSRDIITPRRTLSNKTPGTRSGTAVARAFNRNNFHPVIPIVPHGVSPIYGGPILTSQAPDAFSPLRSTDPERLLDIAPPPTFNRMSGLALRPERPGATGLFRMSSVDSCPPSTPPVVRRGVSPKICTPPEAGAKISKESSLSRKYLNRFGEASRLSTSKLLVRRSSQQRKLLNEDADEDIEIDLDWGDVTSN